MQANNILVAVDFSKGGDVAFELAESLARDAKATLHIAHVKEPFHIYQSESHLAKVPAYGTLDELKKGLEKIVPADPSIAHQHWLLTSEDVVHGILKLAGDLKIDLIVIGTHGRTGLARVMMGSVAEGVLRRAACPVLTVRQPQHSNEPA